MRAVAEMVHEPETKSTMLRIAADYNRLVRMAEERLLKAISAELSDSRRGFAQPSLELAAPTAPSAANDDNHE